MIKVKIPYKLFPIANKYEHWTEKSKRVRKEHWWIHSHIRHLPKLPVTVILTRIAPRPWDSDNLIISFKNIRDAIAQLYFPKDSIGKHDSDECFIWAYDQVKGEAKEYAFLVEIVERKEHRN